VVGVLVLTAYTFYAFAAPLASRKGVMMATGIASLVILLTGIRMWQGVYDFAIMSWLIIKIVCWLGVSALTGMAYRQREKAGRFMTIALLLLTVAVAMVYLKPF
jgi:hypothetical protein